MNRRDRRGRARREMREVARLKRNAARQAEQPSKVLDASRRLFELGRVEEALPALQQASMAHPDNIPLTTALAYALGATGKFSDAIVQYRQLLQREPLSAPLHTNLAVLLMRVGASDEARALLERAHELAPDHANTAFTLGELFEQQGRPDRAFYYYRRAARLFSSQMGAKPTPAQSNDLSKLASAQMWTGDVDGALLNFERALALRPDHPLALTRRGLLFARLGRIPEALESLKRAVAAEPGYAEVQRVIGDLLLNAGQPAAARAYFHTALRLNPGDAQAGFFLAASKSETPEAPPPEYVVKLFDDYAQRFEQHLVDILQYRAPELLCEAVERVTSPVSAGWNVIDLGCGTGLCGPLVRRFSSHLVGVDLSAAMLEKAREKSVYDELIRGDLSQVLGSYEANFDLAISADVFIYLGSLTPIFTAARRALRPGGWLAFTTEANDDEGFVLDTTGRYRHSRAYVEAEASAQGMEAAHIDTIVARTQSGEPVMSDVYVMRLSR